MTEETISKFMVNEHGQILALLMGFRREANKNDAQEAFNKLKKKQERHVLAEEKAIMMLMSRGKRFSVMSTILEQHEELRSIMLDIQDYLQRSLDDYEKSIKNLLDLMKKHIVLEDKEFYPKLDKELAGTERKIIFEELKEAILGNIIK